MAARHDDWAKALLLACEKGFRTTLLDLLNELHYRADRGGHFPSTHLIGQLFTLDLGSPIQPSLSDYLRKWREAPKCPFCREVAQWHRCARCGYSGEWAECAHEGQRFNVASDGEEYCPSCLPEEPPLQWVNFGGYGLALSVKDSGLVAVRREERELSLQECWELWCMMDTSERALFRAHFDVEPVAPDVGLQPVKEIGQ